MKIASAPKRIKRTQPLAFRLSVTAAKQLQALADKTDKSKTALIEEMIAHAYHDTIKAR